MNKPQKGSQFCYKEDRASFLFLLVHDIVITELKFFVGIFPFLFLLPGGGGVLYLLIYIIVYFFLFVSIILFIFFQRPV